MRYLEKILQPLTLRSISLSCSIALQLENHRTAIMECSIIKSRLQCGWDSEKEIRKPTKRKGVLSLKNSLECGLSQQRYKRLTRTRKTGLYTWVCVCVCRCIYMGGVSKLKKSFYCVSSRLSSFPFSYLLSS